MDNEQLYDDIQATKTAFVITFLIAVYCFSMDVEFVTAHVVWKAICTSTGFIIVGAVETTLFLQLMHLKKEYKSIPEDSD
jgi:hypothetical protein